MIKISKVLIADEIEQECVDALGNGDVQVVKKTKLSDSELISLINGSKFDAVIVRSATKVNILIMHKGFAS